MGHPSIDNQTPFALELLALADEEMRPLLVLVAKATYAIRAEGLRLAGEQVPLHVSGVHWGNPEESSYRYEPECAFIKPATDVVLVGHAWAHGQRTREVVVSLRVGPVEKSVRVVGNRVWHKSLGFISMTRPEPFDSIPLVYERAFGGWDRTDPDPTLHTFEARNPVGIGFRAEPRTFEEDLPLPNLEDPAHPIERFGQQVPPAGFGFLCPHWHPRARYAGTYDDAWAKTRKPLLPTDFDRRFFNAAPPELVVPGYLRGTEPVVITNASPRGTLSFSLPAPTAPSISVELSGEADALPEMRLDTVIIDTDEDQVLLLWRGHVPLTESIHDVRAVHATANGLS
ncbi:DUF2169 family type VI secretion system accessory protein [Hyalangium versicolor]|uniref:DUF2169 family type VI secretion system accessory protein n=1 Tax=Hyalangium versicolor TaxID=2861190 RepID=UPI001CC97F63|nr:DUF2169 domain-containing protein [Hyalangium versicolor]